VCVREAQRIRAQCKSASQHRISDAFDEVLLGRVRPNGDTEPSPAVLELRTPQPASDRLGAHAVVHDARPQREPGRALPPREHPAALPAYVQAPRARFVVTLAGDQQRPIRTQGQSERARFTQEIIRPLGISQTFAVPSVAPVASLLPSALNATVMTDPLCSSRASCVPVRGSQR
jgi:hypothetical protein